eukprot:gnl/MRDRNA2_/MRDRNA2_198934_c0_seq1.p1 gnl/MRDRNA2_/MRDRNA2_198934_c0~~gnl/MRDRNA2_/MRDRNA2_198934_c0_seq1.p1  ORF type:complete len:188 (+),score=25.87 gnl/MRDRNA2_/MRDRNA2_198934_c0_seq1:292-855(+)
MEPCRTPNSFFDPFWFGGRTMSAKDIWSFWGQTCANYSLHDVAECYILPGEERKPQALCGDTHTTHPICDPACDFFHNEQYTTKAVKEEKLRTVCALASTDDGILSETCKANFRKVFKGPRRRCCNCLASRECKFSNCIKSVCSQEEHRFEKDILEWEKNSKGTLQARSGLSRQAQENAELLVTLAD